MGKILLSPKILGEHFGTVVLQHADHFSKLHGLDQEKIAKDLNSGARGDEYVRLFDQYFSDDLILRMM